MLRRHEDGDFGVMRINRQREDGWAVIGRPSGAIALGEGGELLMRLHRREAETVAADLNRRHARRRERELQAQWRFSA